MHGCSQRGMHGCVVALGGHVWLLWGGMHGCSVGHAWLLQGGVHGCSWGACMVALGGMHGCSGGHAWLLPGGGAWDTMRYGDTINERAVRILLECILVFYSKLDLSVSTTSDCPQHLSCTHKRTKVSLLGPVTSQYFGAKSQKQLLR